MSFATVKNGHAAAQIEFGSVKSTVLMPGVHFVVPWLDIEEYDVRKKTVTEVIKIVDKNSMVIPVGISYDKSLIPGVVNKMHAEIGIDQVEVKETSSLNAAVMQVLPQYSAVELNKDKREEAQLKIESILSKVYPTFYSSCNTVRITSVGIPKAIADAAVANATQLERNKLAEKKIEGAKNNFAAAEFDAKTKAILSQPQMLELQRLEIDKARVEVAMMYAKKGVSPYGHNNTFGMESLSLIKGL